MIPSANVFKDGDSFYVICPYCDETIELDNDEIACIATYGEYNITCDTCGEDFNACDEDEILDDINF